ncbi:MAG TPA: POTRA domain-containing protein [Niabella sp.]|nr:POTRA domain-containing protein [Niabella sp.]HOZ95871.1 POTRA domain-containing protein [Niabella sp.]HQW15783.1 POTRA domain-containing protein [Niabella sp.]HQX41433.1 POTRA domain-containing protein [Niabella sp.]HRB07263.1 POTRA domain-containing protein [Niabella sp.]
MSSTAQVDTTILIPNTEPTKTPSPAGTNNFNPDSIRIPINEKVLHIRRIYFVGNKLTRKSILVRELPFKEGDTIEVEKMAEVFEKAKTQVMNTSLFHSSEVAISDIEGTDLDIKIKVKERWYIYPIPYVKLVDRNLNQWLDNGVGVSRLDYGIKLNYDNMTRRNDKLRFTLVTGYTKQLSLSYNRPYIDKAMKWGANVNLALGKNHEINYETRDDKQVFYKDPDKYMRNFFKSSLEFSYRPKFYTKHFFGVTYNSISIGDTILKLNPGYLPLGAKEARFPGIYYRLAYQNLDYNAYPTSGTAAELYFYKQGFNKSMNVWYLGLKGQKYWHLGPKSFYNVSALSMLKLPFKQSFYTSPLLGFGDMTMRGYEKYVIDGVAGGMVNATLFRQLTNFSFKIGFLSWLTDRLIPLKIYGKVYGNAGYVRNPQSGPFNRFDNRLLMGGGVGFDVWTVNDFTFKFEFSLNHLGQNGIYLQKKTLF